MIRCICLTCKEVFAEKDGGGVEGDSHGYCPPCAVLAHEQLQDWLAVNRHRRNREAL